MEFLVLFAFTLFLSYANGSNDISKGIATLVGSGVTDYRRAVLWGTFWTAAGSLLSAIVSMKMVKTFENGFVSAILFKNINFLLSVLLGAGGWVILASKFGMPVSTTHAIVGSIVGAGIVSAGYDGIIWSSVTNKIFLPLLLSPLLSFALTFSLFPLIRRPLYIFINYCLCIGSRNLVSVRSCEGVSAVTADTSRVEVVVDEERKCSKGFMTAKLNFLDAMHWVSSGFVCMTRGLNDMPKIAVIIIPLGLVADNWIFFLLSLAMAGGGYLYGLRTTETLSFKITKMDHAEGFTSNIITGILVGSTSHLGLPVSTTHVSSSAIMATGFRRDIKSIDKRIVGEILLSWLVTIPVSAMISAASYFVFTL